ncbi:MAG: hypothetical protein P3C12_14805 [Gemmatimonadota bacterium]|nr:hypothetical protein [Gemmatimonadota bacterium]
MGFTTNIPRQPRVSVRGRAWARAAAMLAVLAGASMLPSSAAHAQRLEQPPVTHLDEMLPDGTIRQIPIAPAKGFNLFAAEDLAFGTLRMSGAYRAAISNQGGPVSQNQGTTAFGARAVSPTIGGIHMFFQMGFAAAAPPSEFRKIRAVHPGINAMSGSLGYTALLWETLVSSNRRWGSADGQFGKSFAGVTAQDGSSCRADGNVYTETGFSLLAQKDCPDTWGSEGFKGKLVVQDSVWLNTFNANKSAFRWDDWRIPASRLDATQFLGTQSVYGFISDYYREQKLRYGSVVPGGSGSPLDGGYPLGLELRVDSYQFASPATRNTQFYQVQMVNKSAAVYGTGIDYDSLYFGTTPGFLFGGIGGQYGSVYFDFNTNTILVSKANTSGNCSTSYPKRYLNTTLGGCQSGDAFNAGVWTMTWLKSPLGDVRNKRFTRDPADPYYNPAHPNADDTITFNHSHAGSVGRASQAMTRSTRAAFGYLSSTEDNFLDGRNPSDFTLNNYAGMVTPEEWSGSLPATPAGVKFPKFVPGATTNPLNGRPFGRWDYNNDGVQDTISVPGCGSLGCHVAFSDTIVGGYRNEYGNILGTFSAGPFKLKAGDTTQFLFAFSWSPDSIATRKTIEGVNDAYRSNYAGPQPFAYPEVKAGLSYTISSAELIDSLTAGAATTIGSQLIVRYPTINPVDPYMISLVNKLRADSAAGDVATRRLLRLNPTLLDSLKARANDNLSSVYVFKSCDGGTTFTNSTGNASTCTSAPTRTIDAGQQAFAWRPVATVNYRKGVPQTANYAETVQAGRTYTYAFVTRTRGFSDDYFRIVDSLPGRGLVITNVQDAFGFPRDTINSAFATSGPASLNIYAPITNAAGRKFARVDTATIVGTATQPVLVQAVSNSVSGTSRMVFGNQFIVRKVQDTVTRAVSTTISARWVLPAATTSATSVPSANFVAKEQTFSTAGDIPFRSGVNLLSGTARGFSGASRVFVDTVAAPTAYPGYLWVTSDNKPIFGINDPYGTNGGNQVRDQVGSPLYPGFTAQPDDTSNTANGFRVERLSGNALRDRNFVIRKDGDTLQGNARQFLPQVQGTFTPATTGPLVGNKRVKGGRYELTWLTDPWGGKSFKLDPVADLRGAVNTALQTVASKATTITETSAAVGALVGATTVRPLVRVRVPFTMKFTDPVGGREETVKFAMLARQSFAQGGIGSTRLLGSGNDTVRVAVPDSVWMPGDTLIVLQKVEKDSTVLVGSTRVVVVQADGANGYRPIPVLADSIGLNKFLVACTGGNNGTGARVGTNVDQTSCNPLAINTRGASSAGGYLAAEPTWKQMFELTRTFDARSTVQLVATPFSIASEITKADLAKVSVVPNPYLVRSDVDPIDGTRLGVPRIFFTNVPEQGVLRVYSVSGQFLQELSWTKSDLTYAGNNSTTGDLPFNLRTREGTDMTSGLYIYVLTATGSAGKNQVQRGKFVIIR